MKFFIYANKVNVKDPNIKNRALYFVPEEEMRIWASKYSPSIMEFCGVSVDADSRDEAKKIFLTPLENDGFDNILSIQEPLLTRFMSRQYENSKEKVGKATMDLMIDRLASLWLQIDDMLRAMAKLYTFRHGDMSEEEAYQKIKNEWLSRYKEK